MSIADVFIIESLSPEDETANRYEGQRLADILRLSGKSPRYFYFRDRAELPHLLSLFKLSQYRFLHVSCHGSDQALFTRSDQLTYPEVGKIFARHLKERRVFLSACELGNELFSTCIASGNKGMHSIVAPAEKIFFDHAAAIWGAFYISIFSHNSNSLRSAEIRARIDLLCQLFPVDFHMSTYHPVHDSWVHERVRKNVVGGRAAK